MNQNLVAIVSQQIISFVKEQCQNRIVSEVEKAKKEGKNVSDAVAYALSSLEDEIAKAKPPQTQVQSSNNSTQSSNNSTQSSSNAAAPKKSSVKKNKIMVDGVVVKCCAKQQKSGEPCKHDATTEHTDGKYYCGIHIRSAVKAQPDKSSAPKKSAPKQQQSNFINTVSGGKAMFADEPEFNSEVDVVED